MALFAEGKLFREAGTGTGGGDKHNKGYFVNESALTTAYPTAEAGDYAIVESTDTVWVWDSDNQEWVDSDQKGQVTSVNGQTGDVTITAASLNALENTGGTMTGDIGFDKTKGLDFLSDISQYSTNLTTKLRCVKTGIKITKDDGAAGVMIGVGNTLAGEDPTALYQGIYPVNGGGAYNASLGTSAHPWKAVFVKNIFNGAQIVVPQNTAGTMVVADYTSASQGDVLTLDSNGNAVWAAGGGGGGSTSAIATLATNAWSNNSQTANVTGVTANNNVIVAPAPASQADYTAAGILCTAQGAGTLTFTCTTTPSSAITVNVLIL